MSMVVRKGRHARRMAGGRLPVILILVLVTTVAIGGSDQALTSVARGPTSLSMVAKSEAGSRASAC